METIEAGCEVCEDTGLIAVLSLYDNPEIQWVNCPKCSRADKLVEEIPFSNS